MIKSSFMSGVVLLGTVALTAQGVGVLGGCGGSGGSGGSGGGTTSVTTGTGGSGGTGGMAATGGNGGTGGSAATGGTGGMATGGGGGTGGSGGGADACIKAGGTVSKGLCCAATGDFPDLCSVGACGCAPANSHEVKTCDCPATTCWNGTDCVPTGG